MAEVLSQNEIDALLSAVSTGAVDTAPAMQQAQSQKSSGDYVTYDLTSHEKVVKGRLVGLQGIHERFARNFRITLSNSLRKSITVNMTNIDYIRFGDYLTNVLLPTSINILSMPELKGNMLFVCSAKMAYALMDAYYGGNERPFSKIGGRDEFTPIENNIIRKTAAMALEDLQAAWKLNYPMKLEFVRSESNPQFVGCIHTSEMVAVVSFDVEFDSLSGPFVVIIQLRALDSIQQAVSVNVTGETEDDSNAWRDHWLNELMTTELDVRVDLGVVERSLREVQNFKTGDELVLDQDHAAPIPVLVQGITKFEGVLGAYRGNRAIRLISDLGEVSSKKEEEKKQEKKQETSEEKSNG